jgi:heavy metal sensor kinase
MPSRVLRRSGGRTLRVRLTLWYLLLMGLTLLLFSSYLYVRTLHSLINQTDAALQVAASQAFANLDNENGRPGFQNTENTQTVARRLSESGFAVRLLTPDGSVWDGFGDYTAVPPWTPTSPGYVTLARGNTRWRLYAQPLQAPDGRIIGWLQVAQSLEAVQEALGSLRTQLLLGLPLVLLLAGVGGLFLADRALRPMDHIARTAQAISASDLTRRIAYHGPADEVGRLANTFDHMLDRLQAAFERERRFTADASHELRTPLTTLKGRLDVTLSQPRSRVEYEDTLRDLGREVNRLIRLSTDLLFLARLDEGHLHLQPEALDFNDLLDALIEQVQPLAEAKGVSLITESPAGLVIHGDPDHLIRLFLNLLDNAIKYTPPGGQVTVRAGNEGAGVRVAIGDTGPGIPSEAIPHLFERFYRVEAARSRESGGAGLGLAIAYEIARWHGGTLEVRSEPGQDTTFAVFLPAPVKCPRNRVFPPPGKPGF